MISNCSKCGKYPIQNKWFKLCKNCNEDRLKAGKEKKTNKPKIKVLSYAEKEFKTRVHEFYRDFNQYHCSGCLKSGETTRLTISHTIPVSLRKDLEFDVDNVKLECMSCHQKWEHGSPVLQKTLLNYNSKIEYIKKVWPEYFERRFKKDFKNLS